MNKQRESEGEGQRTPTARRVAPWWTARRTSLGSAGTPRTRFCTHAQQLSEAANSHRENPKPCSCAERGRCEGGSAGENAQSFVQCLLRRWGEVLHLLLELLHLHRPNIIINAPEEQSEGEGGPWFGWTGGRLRIHTLPSVLRISASSEPIYGCRSLPHSQGSGVVVSGWCSDVCTGSPWERNRVPRLRAV